MKHLREKGKVEALVEEREDGQSTDHRTEMKAGHRKGMKALFVERSCLERVVQDQSVVARMKRGL